MRPLRAAWAVTLGLAALRLWLAGRVGLGDDEAYYWTWALEPGLLTYDHPPLVAWLIAASTAAFGDTSWAVRLPFVACGVATAGVLGGWTRQTTGDARAGALALVAFGLVPVFALGHGFAAPDMPALLATAVAGRAVQAAGAGREGAWAAAGLAVGLGLWAKLTVGLVPLSVLLWLAWRGRGRGLGARGPWLAAALALLVWAPWLFVQAGAGWPTVRFHAIGRHGARPGLLGLGTMVAGQIAYVSPVLAGVALFALARSGRSLAAALAWPPLLLFTLAGALTRALPHWTAVGWLVALVPASGWLVTRPRWTAAALGPAALLTALLYAQALTPLLDLGPADPTHDPHGWRAFAAAARPLLARDGCTPVVVGTRYQTGAQAAWAFGRGGPRVAAPPPGAGEAWGARRPDDACPGTDVVASSRYPLDRHGCALLLTHPVERGGRVVRTLSLHRCPD